jgi:hypothetical protein
MHMIQLLASYFLRFDNCIIQSYNNSAWSVQLNGPIPPDIGTLPRLRELELSGNEFSGPLPRSLSLRNSTLTGLKVANNNFSGDLLPLANVELVQIEVHGNPLLCGMVCHFNQLAACAVL